jgi:hypothetical protein
MKLRSIFRRTKSPTLSGAILLLVLLPLPPESKAQSVAWTVTITADPSSEDPTYMQVLANPLSVPSCVKPPSLLPTEIWACPGDTVNWQAATPKNPASKKMQSEMHIHHPTKILRHPGTVNVKHRVRAFDGGSDGGTIDAQAIAGAKYEYCVSIYDQVYDQKNPHLFIHDPKIVIGGKPVLTGLLDDIQKKVEELQNLVRENANAEKLTQQMLRDTAALRKNLNSQTPY